MVIAFFATGIEAAPTASGRELPYTSPSCAFARDACKCHAVITPPLYRYTAPSGISGPGRIYQDDF